MRKTLTKAAIVTSLLLFGILLFVCHQLGVEYRDSSDQSPVGCFKVTFDEAPDPHITGLHEEGNSDWNASEDIYLAFQTDRATFNRLLGSRFHPISRHEFSEDTATSGVFGQPRAWWTPMTGRVTIFLSSTGFHPTYSEGRAYAAYNPITQQAYLYWSGID